MQTSMPAIPLPRCNPVLPLVLLFLCACLALPASTALAQIQSDYAAYSLSRYPAAGESREDEDDDDDEGEDDGSPVHPAWLFGIDPATGAQEELGTLTLGRFTWAQLATLPSTGEVAALLYRGYNPRVAVIDPVNLQVVSVSAIHKIVSGMSVDPFTSTIYVTHGGWALNKLGTLDPSTGEVTTLGVIDFPGGYHAIDVLSFSPSGQLYGFERVYSQKNTRIWRIDTNTLEATLVGTTPKFVDKFDDAVFVGESLWGLRRFPGELVQLSTDDASVLATTALSYPRKYGIAAQGCVVPSVEVTAQDRPGDSGGAVELDWTGYLPPANLVRYDIVRSASGCEVAAGGGVVVGSVAAGLDQVFTDDTVDDYTTYFYGIQVVTAPDIVAEQLSSADVAAFPNVLINEFAPAGGVSKGSHGNDAIQVGEFVELFNLAPDAIDLTGWLLSNGIETEPLAGVIPGNGLFVHTVAVIDLPDDGGVFQLLPPGGSSFIVDDVSYGSEGGAPTAPSGFTISRVEGTDSSTPDEEAFSTSIPTPAATNVAAPPNLGGSLVLNEVYYLGNANEDYIELFNPTGGTIALQRFAISDGVGFIDTLDTNLDLRPGGWFVLDSNSLDPFVQDLTGVQLYLYKITETGLFELVDHLGWGPGTGDPPPPAPDAVNNTLVRNADGDALYLGDIGTNWIECGGDITLFYGPPSPGGPNTSPQEPTLLVDQGGGGDFTNITDALAAATAGTRILVSPGIYEERFNLKDGVSISGIGELPQDVIIGGPGGHTPIQAFGVGSTTEVSRLSVRGGYAANDGPFLQTPASGGGLRVVSGSPIFKNVRFEYNLADNNGGAIAIAGGTPTFEGCQFLNNFSNDAGGAVWMVDGNATFRSCLFVGNKSGTDGGVFFMEGGNLNLEQCVMDNNTTGGSGIVYATGGFTLIEYSMITNSIFGDALTAVSPGSIQFGCGLLYNNTEIEGVEAQMTSGQVTTFNVVGGDPLYCQPLAFNYAYPDASPVNNLSSVCAKVIGISGAPCGQILTDTDPRTPPSANRLLAPHPNPFNPATVLHFELQTPGRAEIVVYDVRGRRVVELLGGGVYGSGAHKVQWRGHDASGRAVGSGLYFARLRVDGVDVGDSQKLVLLK